MSRALETDLPLKRECFAAHNRHEQIDHNHNDCIPLSSLHLYQHRLFHPWAMALYDDPPLKLTELLRKHYWDHFDSQILGQLLSSRTNSAHVLCDHSISSFWKISSPYLWFSLRLSSFQVSIPICILSSVTSTIWKRPGFSLMPWRLNSVHRCSGIPERKLGLFSILL